MVEKARRYRKSNWIALTSLVITTAILALFLLENEARKGNDTAQFARGLIFIFFLPLWGIVALIVSPFVWLLDRVRVVSDPPSTLPVANPGGPYPKRSLAIPITLTVAWVVFMITFLYLAILSSP